MVRNRICQQLHLFYTPICIDQKCRCLENELSPIHRNNYNLQMENHIIVDEII